MRLSARNVYASVCLIPESERYRVCMQIGGNSYRLDVEEAILLSNQLVDAVEQLNSNERTTP